MEEKIKQAIHTHLPLPFQLTQFLVIPYLEHRCAKCNICVDKETMRVADKVREEHEVIFDDFCEECFAGDPHLDFLFRLAKHSYACHQCGLHV
jgi:hypothetical protein